MTCIAYHTHIILTALHSEHLGSNELEHIVDGRLDVTQVKPLHCESLIHMLLVRRPAQRGNTIQLSNLKQCLRGRASLRGTDRPDGRVPEEARRARERPERSVRRAASSTLSAPSPLRGLPDVLILYPMLDAVRPDVTIPPVPLEPAVLHDVRPSAAIALERLEHGDVVRVAHADFADDARGLEGDERAPGGERLRERAEGRVQDEAVEVDRAEVLERGLYGGMDLGRDVCGGVVWERLVLVLAVDGGEPVATWASDSG